MERMPKFSDKLMHFGAYGGLAFLLSLWLSSRGSWTKRSALLVLGVVAIYGICDELLQIPVNRSAEPADYLADMLGACAGTAVFTAVREQVWRLLGSVLGTKSA
jgi:VanZ family protein